jgi:haloalkane dehalogenase
MTELSLSLPAALRTHREAGSIFHAHGIASFVRQAGAGEPVVFVHGMWGASFLYRKVLLALAAHNVRAVAFDLPGFGFADRPVAYDYTWTGLGSFAAAAVRTLELDAFHLVVHDIGGPVGFEMAARLSERVRSLTILNTMIDVTRFNPPWPMRPFRRRGLGAIWLRGLNQPVFRTLMRMQGVSDTTAVTRDELDAHLALMRHGDGGRAFLQVMRGAERTADKQRLYRTVVSSPDYPVQVIWARDDPALPLHTYGAQAAQATGTRPITISGKHFPQEDYPDELADHIVQFVHGVARGARKRNGAN